MQTTNMKYPMFTCIILWLTVSGSFMYIALYRQLNVGKKDIYANNITFTVSSEQMNSTVHQPNLTKSRTFLNVQNLIWTLEPTGSPCTGTRGTRTFIILIHSSRPHFLQRNLIRESWGSLKVYRKWRIVLVFLIGMGNSSNSIGNDIDNQLFQEHKTRNDLVIGNFIDNYDNLTYKSIMGLKWALDVCPEADFVLKTNDSMFIDIMEWLDWRIDEVDNNNIPNTDLFCEIPINSRPVDNELNNGLVSLVERGNYEYPPYCSGLAYALGMDIIKKLLAVVGQAEYVKSENVFTTRVLIALAEREFNSEGWKPVITNIKDHITPYQQTNYWTLCRTRAWNIWRSFEMVVHVHSGEYFERDMMCLWNKTVRDKKVDASLKPVKVKLIEKERKQIAQEMKGYNFTGTRIGTVDNLKEMPPGRNEIIRNVIFARYRGGSTFMGELVSSHPGTFYEYEPLKYSGVPQVTTRLKAMEAIDIFMHIFSCNQTNIPNWRHFARKFSSSDVKRYSFCSSNLDICRDAKFLSDVCKLFPIQSMKTNRIQLKFAKSLLENKRLNIRIILLVRDPRAIMQSRGRDKVYNWCKLSPDCYDSKIVCGNMWEDVMYADLFRRKYPKTFLSLRYEDIALNPFSAAKKIFAFYGLQVHPKVIEFLRTHSNINQGGPYSTFRDSKNAVHHWKQDYYSAGNFTKVVDIQNNCKEMMKAWGYAAAENETDLLSRNLLLPPPWPKMLIEEE